MDNNNDVLNDFHPFFSHYTLPHTSVGLTNCISIVIFSLKNCDPFDHYAACCATSCKQHREINSIFLYRCARMVFGQYFCILWICLILIFATMTFFYFSQAVRWFSHSKVKQFLYHNNTRLNVPVQMDNKTVMKSPIVHTAMSLNRDKFVLFTHDVPKGSGKYMCMVNDKRIQGEQIFLNTFQCDKPKNGTLQNGDLLSIKTSLGETLPSIAVWVNRLTMKDLGYSKMTLCIVTMVKDEEKEVEDWIKYHLRQGVEAFICYDNNCSENTITILRRFKQVIIIDWPWQHTQEDASLHGILYTRGTCLWSLYMDIDEFLFPVANHRNQTV